MARGAAVHAFVWHDAAVALASTTPNSVLGPVARALTDFLRATGEAAITNARNVLALIGARGGFGWAQLVLTVDDGRRAETLCDWSEGRLPRGFADGGSREHVTLDDYPCLIAPLLEGRAICWPHDATLRLSASELVRFAAMGVERLVVLPFVAEQGLDGAAFFMGERAGDAPSEDDLASWTLACELLGQALLRRRGEERLRRSEARFRLLSEVASEGVVVHDGQNILDVNTAAATLIGRRVDEVLGAPIIGTFLTAEDVARHSQRIARAQGNILELDLRSAEGQSVPVETEARSAVLDGRLVRVAILRDLRERRRVEAALRAGETRMRRLLASTYDGVATSRVDDGRIVEADHNFARLFGYSNPDEVIGLHVRDLCAPESLHVVEAAVREGIDAPYEIVGLRRDGSTFPLEVLATVVEHGGERSRIAGFLDLTEMKARAEAQRQIDQRLQHAQKLESLGLLAGGIAHDFNNLLVGILGHADLALLDLQQGDGALEDAMRTHVDQIRRSALRASELTHQMLAYVGRGVRALRPLDLNELVGETAELLGLSIPKRVSVQFELEPNLPAIAADASQVRQVVMNLLTNAGEAIGENPGRVVLATGALHIDRPWLVGTVGAADAEPGPYVYLRVSDTGAGMDEQTLSRIFDPFFTTKFTGRGLGLAAVLGIVRAHRGVLKVRSVKGRGSTLWVAFPTTDEPIAVSGEMAAVSIDKPVQATSVLVVDDERVVRDVAVATLRRVGYDVHAAGDGVAGIDAFDARDGGFDLVLLDLTMPGVPGEEVFAHLRGRWPHLPVLFASGGERPDFLDLAESGPGRVDFLPKPFRTQDLLARVRALLGA